MKKEHRFRHHLIKMMATVLLFVAVFQPVTALAYDIVTTQTTVDTTNWEILAGVVTEDVDGSPNEGKRIGKDALKKLAANNGDPGVGAELLDALNVAEEGASHEDEEAKINLVLSFPGKPRDGVLWFNGSSTEFDESRATVIKDILVYDLNSAYDFVYEGQNPDGLEDYKAKMVALLNAVSSAVNGSTGSVNSYSVNLATSSDISSVDDPTMEPSDYVVISNGDDEEIFAYRVPKGYVKISGREDSLDETLDLQLSSSEEASYITWGEFAYEAFANCILDEKLGLTAENVFSTEPGALEAMLVGMFGGLIDGLTNLLGLWGIDELILNAGVRGGSGYVGGIFPASWEPLIWTFFFITEVLALIVLSFAILAGIYKRAMATVNPIARASFMEQVKDLCIAIFVLILLPIIFRLMISTSATLTEIFTSALGNETAKEKFSILTKSSGLAGCIMQLVYLASLIYFNFFYYLRSLIVAVIIALSPLLIIAYAVGDNWKNITIESMKTVVSAIFIQPIQALCLVMILLLPVDGRGFQSIVAIYALIPLTNMVRSLVFRGPSGLHMAAKSGEANTMRYMRSAGRVAGKFATGAALGAAGAIAGGIAARGGKNSDSGDGSSTDSPGGENNAINQKPGKAEQAAAQQTEQNNPSIKGKAKQTAADVAAFGREKLGQVSEKITQGTDAIHDTGELIVDGHPIQAAQKIGRGAMSLGRGAVSVGRKAAPGIKRAAASTGGVALAAVGGGLAAAGVRTGLAQVGQSTFANAVARRPAGGAASNAETVANQEVQDQVDTPQNHPIEPPTPIDVGKRYAAGDGSMDDISSLESADYGAVDGIRMQGEGDKYQANEDTLGRMGMFVSKPVNTAPEGEKPKWNRTSDRTITYTSSMLGARDQANLAAAEQAFRSGSPEQIQALQKTGMKNVTATYQNIDGKKKAVEYQVEVSDTKAFHENYGINLNDQWHSSSGSKERGASFTGGSITPNIIDNPKVSFTPPTRQPSQPAPQPAPQPEQQNTAPDRSDPVWDSANLDLENDVYPEQQ